MIWDDPGWELGGGERGWVSSGIEGDHWVSGEITGYLDVRYFRAVREKERERERQNIRQIERIDRHRHRQRVDIQRYKDRPEMALYSGVRIPWRTERERGRQERKTRKTQPDRQQTDSPARPSQTQPDPARPNQPEPATRQPGQGSASQVRRGQLRPGPAQTEGETDRQ